MATTTRVLTASVNGTVYTSNANGALEALDTCHSGSTAPTDEVSNGKLWLDTTTTPSVLKVYDNAAWNIVYSGRDDLDVEGTMTAATLLGDGSGLTGIIAGMTFTTKTANYTAAHLEGVLADTSGGAFTITLPATPSDGDYVVVSDGDDWSTTNLTVARNGSTIEGDSSDMTMDIGGALVTFIYDGTTWQIYTTVASDNSQFATSAQGDLADTSVQPNDSPTFANITTTGIDDNATSTAITIDASENVGIGVSSPTAALDVKTSSAAYRIQLTHSSGQNMIKSVDSDGVSYRSLMQDAALYQFLIAGSEAMRIDASGSVLVGKTAEDATVAGMSLRANGVGVFTRASSEALYANRLTTDGAVVKFARQTTTVGSISVTGSATAYNTSSDYRLKENVTPIQGAADIVMAMQPCTYTAIADGVWYDGFLAHELQEVHPRAVQGTKDAMQDEEYEITPATETEEAVMGTRSVPDMQSVDYSKLTPILTAALQEALTEIADLKARVTALEELT